MSIATKSKKQTITVRAYQPGQTQYGNESIGKITGDFGRYEVVETIQRSLRTEEIGNFAPMFCSYKGDKRCLVHSDAGDLSDPFRAEESYLGSLFIIKPTYFEIGTRVKLANPQPSQQALNHGVVVHYKGKHSPKNPRVRWASGFGTSCNASLLVELSAQEKEELPHPALCPND